MPSRAWSFSRCSGSLLPTVARSWSSPSQLQVANLHRGDSLRRWTTSRRSASTSMRGRRWRYFSSMRSTQRFGGSLTWQSAETMKYLFGAPGVATCVQPSCARSLVPDGVEVLAALVRVHRRQVVVFHSAHRGDSFGLADSWESQAAKWLRGVEIECVGAKW